MIRKEPNATKYVESYLWKHPMVRDLLRRGLLNHTAVAREIIDDAQREGIELTLGAVKMALLRISEEMKRKKEEIERKLLNVIKESVIQVQSDLIIFTVEKRNILGKMRDLSRLMEDARFFQLTQGVDIFNILVAKEMRGEVLKILGEDKILDVTDEQTAIILISPEENIRTPGFIHLLTSVLSYHGINITQIISCHKDTVFVFHRKDAIHAYEVLENFIISLRE